MECSNASQVTLVNPNPPLELVLDNRKTVANTQLLVNGRPRYKISTVDRDALNTDVTDLRTNEVIASVRRRILFPDKVQFSQRFGGKSIKKDSWMVNSKLKSGHQIWTIHSEIGTFVWRLDPVLRMVLTPKNSPDDILAHIDNDPHRAFKLVVERAGEGSLDEIILAFALIEHGMRLEASAGWTGPNVYIPGSG